SSWANAATRAEDGRGVEELRPTARVGSAASRDLYATSDGSIYKRQDGNWYRADAGGKWAYAAPAVEPKASSYNSATAENVQRPGQYDRTQGANVQRPAQYDRAQGGNANVERPGQYD